MSNRLHLYWAAHPNPTHQRECASNDAQRGKSDDEPGEFGRVRNAENPASKLDSGQTNENKPDGAGKEDIAKESELGVLECARGCDDRSEWKRRWRETGNHQWDGRAVAHFSLQVVETFAAHHFFEAFLATFATHQIQQQNSNRRS